MNKNQAIQYINAQTITPDQLLPYVLAVSNSESELIEDCVIHKQQNQLVVVGYPLSNPHNIEQVNTIIKKINTRKDIDNITILAPTRPQDAPQHAISSEQDYYWMLSLPEPALTVKVRNMLHRADREIDIRITHGQGAWTGAHQELMLSYIQKKKLQPSLCSILQRLGTYIITSQDVLLFSAYAKNSQNLLAFALGDFSSLMTSFYMFAFRQETASPGVADAVLYALLNESKNRGYLQCNLGLGINSGIEFFKKKWGAKPLLPFIQTSWQIDHSRKTWFSRFIN